MTILTREAAVTNHVTETYKSDGITIRKTAKIHATNYESANTGKEGKIGVNQCEFSLIPNLFTSIKRKT